MHAASCLGRLHLTSKGKGKQKEESGAVWVAWEMANEGRCFLIYALTASGWRVVLLSHLRRILVVSARSHTV